MEKATLSVGQRKTVATSTTAPECSNHAHTNGTSISTTTSSTTTITNKLEDRRPEETSNSLTLNSLLTHFSYHSMMSSGVNLFTRSKCYAASLRPGSFVSSLIPVLLGTVLAFKATGQFSLLILVGTIVTVVGVHAAGNLVNTYHDYKHGIDSKPKSEDRTLVDHILTTEEVVNLGNLDL